MPKVTETRHETSKGSPTSAAASIQQGCVGAVIAAGYFKVFALNEPECG